MRLRYGFTLTAMLTLVPAIAWGQEGRSPGDPVYPFPLGDDQLPQDFAAKDFSSGSRHYFTPRSALLANMERGRRFCPLGCAFDWNSDLPALNPEEVEPRLGPDKQTVFSMRDGVVITASLSSEVLWPGAYAAAPEVTEGMLLFSLYEITNPATGSLMFGLTVSSDAGLPDPDEAIARKSFARSLLDPDPRTRLATIKGLARLRNDAVVVPAIRGVLRTDPCPSVRVAAARALLSMGAVGALADLELAAKADVDPRVRLAAEIAVEHIRESALLGAGGNGTDAHMTE